MGCRLIFDGVKVLGLRDGRFQENGGGDVYNPILVSQLTRDLSPSKRGLIPSW